MFYPISDQRTVVLVVADRKDAYKGVSDLEKRLRQAV
jgi:hypothetical protein